MNVDDLSLEQLENQLRSHRYSLNKRKASKGWNERRTRELQNNMDKIQDRINKLKGDVHEL